LCIAFQATIVSRVKYAISAWGGFLTPNLPQQIDAFFFRARQNDLSNDISFASLLFAADQMLFNSINLSIVSTQSCHLPYAPSIICVSEVMHTSSWTLEPACIKIFSFALFIWNS
jgi:hypothetical protein